jgi:hypothetical protein
VENSAVFVWYFYSEGIDLIYADIITFLLDCLFVMDIIKEKMHADVIRKKIMTTPRTIAVQEHKNML